MKGVVDVIIPAWNEQEAIGKVIDDIPRDIVREVIVVDNNSTDQTSSVAEEHGAVVLSETIQGYGAACLRGINYVRSKETAPDIIVFIDADYADYPEELSSLIQPIIHDNYDFVVGSRQLGQAEIGALMPQQVFGNTLATTMLKWLYGIQFTDLGPFRAIRFDRLIALNMKDLNYGWTVEMQIKAAKQKLKCLEVPVRYRKRIGVSKVSGTVKGSVLAGYKIIATLIKYA